MTPSSELYSSLQLAFSHFNGLLFDGQLPEVIFTVQRQKGVMGYFSPKRWGSLAGRKCDEIAINPSYIANCRLIEVMQTLVHEMVHCWQYNFGKPGRDYYHNKEWALKMIRVGLMPSSTGEPGGEITGQHMGDYIIEGGEFLKAFKQLEQDQAFQLTWVDRKALPRLYNPVIVSSDQIGLVKPITSSESISAPTDTGGWIGMSKPITSSESISAQTERSETVSAIQSFPVLPHQIETGKLRYTEMFPENFVEVEETPKKTRSRYICHGCSTKVYGKPQLNIRCEDCNLLFECEEL